MEIDYNENVRLKNCARQKRWYYSRINAKRLKPNGVTEQFSFNNDPPFQAQIRTNVTDKIFPNFNSEKELYPNSKMKYGEFLVVFFALVDKIDISGEALDFLLKFIKSVLPDPNFVPSSVYMLDKELNIEQNNLKLRQYVCISCDDKIAKGELCSKLECERFRSLAVNRSKINPYFITNNYKLHFKRVIKKSWPQILEYKQILDRTNLITDVCNAQAYKTNQEITHNSICLILFIDEAEMTKTTKENNIYNILGLIVNLPLRMRSFNLNIINFMIVGGYINNFNNFFQYFEPPLEQFFNHLFEIDETLTVCKNIFKFLNF
jgi:hypothetical protein